VIGQFWIAGICLVKKAWTSILTAAFYSTLFNISKFFI